MHHISQQIKPAGYWGNWYYGGDRKSMSIVGH